jgi:hypothetical protein
MSANAEGRCQSLQIRSLSPVSTDRKVYVSAARPSRRNASYTDVNSLVYSIAQTTRRAENRRASRKTELFASQGILSRPKTINIDTAVQNGHPPP